jgi:glycosyltransferase involved in cell wall biosynthesis
VSTPTFSVVMPAYEARACIDRALASIAAQTQPVHEVVVVDDGSRDGTSAAVEAWRDRLPVLLLKNDANRGIGPTLRRGVEAASGEWILRLDADDRWLPGHVAAMTALARLPDVELLTSAAVLVDESGNARGRFEAADDRRVRARLMWDNPLIHSATGFRREACVAAGGYRDGVRWEDYDLWIRLLARGRLGAHATPTVEYTVSAGSLSRTRRSVAIAGRWQCQRQAIARFWRRHPLAALRAGTLGAARVLLSPVH